MDADAKQDDDDREGEDRPLLLNDAPSPSSRVSLTMVVTSAAAALGSFLSGYNTGVVAGAMLYIIPEFDLEERPAMQGFIVSVALMGAALSALAAGYLADRFGRLAVLRASAILHAAAGAMLWWGMSLAMLVVGRFVAGLGIGLVSVVVFLYIAECAPSEQRGRFNSIPQLLITSGILTAYCVSLAVALTGARAFLTIRDSHNIYSRERRLSSNAGRFAYSRHCAAVCLGARRRVAALPHVQGPRGRGCRRPLMAAARRAVR